MDQTPNSFIPKAPVTSAAKTMRRDESSIGIMGAIALLCLFSSLFTWGAAYGYNQYLGVALAKEQATLTELTRNLDPNSLRDIQALDVRLKRASELLTNHVSASRLFETLQDSAVATVRFTNFTFSGNQMTVKGVARDYEDIAAEAVVLKQFKDRIQTFSFGNFTRVEKGGINFNLTITVTPAVLRYTASLPSIGLSATSTATTTSNATTTAPRATSTPAAIPNPPLIQ